mmetsp:Transcript_21379/g.46793  ORF Transcript_21379/g.46793 Transcript_21379/m.46793 type:complete len:209 (-) Transcript_21379:586-1212(-)
MHALYVVLVLVSSHNSALVLLSSVHLGPTWSGSSSHQHGSGAGSRCLSPPWRQYPLHLLPQPRPRLLTQLRPNRLNRLGTCRTAHLRTLLQRCAMCEGIEEAGGEEVTCANGVDHLDLGGWCRCAVPCCVAHDAALGSQAHDRHLDVLQQEVLGRLHLLLMSGCRGHQVELYCQGGGLDLVGKQQVQAARLQQAQEAVLAVAHQLKAG